MAAAGRPFAVAVGVEDGGRDLAIEAFVMLLALARIPCASAASGLAAMW
jgi:hypothetical protein